VKTPNLDKLASQGVRFSNAYTPQALCTPARGSLMTGVYPHTTRLTHNLYGTDDAFALPQFRLTPNLPTLLREAGYRTAYIGKWHLGEKNPGFFDYWNAYNSMLSHWLGKRDESPYRTDVETDEAMKFLEENQSRPFALFVSYYPPHNLYDPPRKYIEMYPGREHADYYGAVTAVDWNVGRLLDKLNGLKMDGRTFVSFTADHGETFGERLGSTNKTVSYDDSAKVPLLMRWPGHIPPGVDYRGGVTTLDLMPSILEAAGIPLPSRLEGFSRLEEVRSGRTGWNQPVFLENITDKVVQGPPDRQAVERAVRTERWKLILRDHPRSELYDIQADPGEKNDLFSREPAKVKELAQLILNWGEKMGDDIAVKLAKYRAG
jgi:choline-sulfatase